jgi:hypothetical protein
MIFVFMLFLMADFIVVPTRIAAKALGARKYSYTKCTKQVIILRRSKYPITTLLSITIARYCSIKRLVLENLSTLKIDH